jgi:hypothetical protein
MLGTIITGVGEVQVGSLSSAVVTSIVLGFCGHIGIIVTGSGSCKASNISKATVGSMFVGVFSGTIISGNTNIQVGD